MGTLLLIVLIQRIFKGFMATVAVLVGLVVGTLVAWALGDATSTPSAARRWVGVTTPFYFGWPEVQRRGDHLDDRRHADHRGRDHR